VVEPVETFETRPVLFAIKGDPTPEEVAALVAVLQGVASSAAPAEKPRRSEWSAPHRLVRTPLASGPGGWRSSSLPR
jgi:hypothetical protein